VLSKVLSIDSLLGISLFIPVYQNG
jgi:hypothetical protein